jgi:hypothetical protein
MNKLLVLLAASSLFACVANTADRGDEGDTEESEGAASIASTSTYYRVRQDFRRCMFPMCGGHWVSRVNKSTTQCSDGTWASECYVATIDWSSAGLTQDDVNNSGATSLVLRGTIGWLEYDGFGKFGAFKTTEAWGSTIPEDSTGSFYRVKDNGIRCITTPCFSLTADKLNTTTTRTLSSLAGTYGGKAGASLPVIATGTVSNTKGGGRALSVTKFWTQIKAAPSDPLACSTDADCTTTAYNKTVTSSSGCYCALCPSTIMNVTAADEYRASWETYCSGVSLTCPLVKCIAPPAVVCVSNQCVAASPS